AATDTVTGSINGTTNQISVSAAAASRLVVAGSPTTLTAGNTISLMVTAQDQFGNTATGYTGTVHFSSTDAQAVLPANYTFVAADNGAHTFTNAVTHKTAGNQTVTATDTLTSTITGTSGTISVNPAGATTLSVAASIGTVAAGTAFGVTV